ncbi:chlorophyll synthase ChlG [Candidatus Synechococcus spongiarum]|uniref:Chlorophyll a synthase ChlG n=1 Tax=Candidatus Synechococcus spongiarum TaxID=431041 RepID=A0A171DG07_9SYNE|nr:chlorophyll synthase ChlG [Candidatus Synechococcus spongiarum]SAY38642.1 Chlorophyll a synthase ChlG (EC 2.5.1.62) [Candidatus Synechococcus spongiarum]
MGQTTDARQLLGMKKASRSRNIWVIRLQLMKPITWIPLIWGVLCGAAASGQFQWRWDHLVAALLCMVLSGPLMAGFTQTINDFYDRDIDAINEPYRPIPSGAIPLLQVRVQVIVLLVAGLVLAWMLDRWSGHTTPTLFFLALGGSLVSILYSAPPIKLKQNGWLGNYALGASYIALPWWAGQALFGHLSWPIIGLTLVYSLAGLGIAVVNDFKSMAGDRQLGLQSLPVLLGARAASWVSAALMDGFQLLIAVVLMGLGQQLAGTVLVLLVIPQVVFQDMWLLRDPLRFDVQYQAGAQPFLVLGMLVSAVALGHSILA